MSDYSDEDALDLPPPNPNHILPPEPEPHDPPLQVPPRRNKNSLPAAPAAFLAHLHSFNPDQPHSQNPLYTELCDINNPFVFFHGGYQSQWHKARMNIDGQTYNTCEQFMMAEKAALFEDWATRKEILRADKPKQQKALGRKVRGFSEREWVKHRFNIVVRGNMAKFTQNEELKQKLLDTGDRVLVEASPNDGIWGIGLHESVPEAKDMATWEGSNLLGQALVCVRELIRLEEEGTAGGAGAGADSLVAAGGGGVEEKSDGRIAALSSLMSGETNGSAGAAGSSAGADGNHVLVDTPAGKGSGRGKGGKRGGKSIKDPVAARKRKMGEEE